MFARVRDTEDEVMMETPEGTKTLVQTSLLLGVQLDEFDYRVFLREYHKDLRQRAEMERFPAYSPETVLDELIQRVERGCDTDQAGARYAALRDFSQRAFRLRLGLTATDYGRWEQRASPYGFERATYHIGVEVARGELTMNHPGYNPYRSTRKLDIPFIREQIDPMLEMLPDYLWWAIQDRRDQVRNILAPEKQLEAERRIESAGFKLDTFGLYLTTFEGMLFPEDDAPAS